MTREDEMLQMATPTPSHAGTATGALHRLPRSGTVVRHGCEGRPVVSLVAVADEVTPRGMRELSDRVGRWSSIGVELIIVCASRRDTRSIVSALCGGLRRIEGPPDASEMQLRAVGLAAASGDIVLLVDDPATVQDEWIRHVSITGTPWGMRELPISVGEARRGGSPRTEVDSAPAALRCER